ncbi:MAG TPA: hypothetical protein VK760_00310, partial [Candidatus Acidoferrales bacterium]|nr:hypothetical protein [Candidatus Acidoferrales bacterium]
MSAATKSLSLLIASGSTTVLDTKIDLMPHSPNCSTTPAGTVCSFAYSFLRGSYVATLNTYDGLQGRGNVLSSAQKIAFAITPATTQIALTLDGVPHRIGVAAGSYAMLGTQA